MRAWASFALTLLCFSCAAGGEADGPGPGGSSGSAGAGLTGGSGGTGGTGASAGAGGSAGAAAICGDSVCAPTEDCVSCAQDCSCSCEAPSCSGASAPPAQPITKLDWNIKLEPISGAARDARIAALLDRDPKARAILRAWLGSPAPEVPSALVDVGAPLLQSSTALSARLRPLVALPSQALPPHSATATPGSSAACGRPLLRARVARIEVLEEVDDIRNDVVYCVVNAEAPSKEEVRVTPTTPKLDNGQSYNFTVKEGTFWGTDQLRDPEGNLTITYDCIEQDNASAYSELIQAVGNALQKVGEQQENAWLSSAGTAATIVNMALAQNSDDHVFNAQQTLDANEYLNVASGVKWTITKQGKHIASNWQWRLTVEMWGCAELAGGS